MEQFRPIQVDESSDETWRRTTRINCLGSLYYFIKVGLQRKRLTPKLHLPLCQSLEKDRLKDAIAFPRDHFKSTICTEGAPMWWALPLSQEDIDDFYQLGYSDEFVRFMRRVHDPTTTTLLASENITNASKLGFRVRWHFESNSRYRLLFPETLPTPSEVWSNISLHIKRPSWCPGRGEGAFDFIGVGGALQSRHYKRLVEDDLVGKKAIESPAIMQKTIEYHQLLPGAFEVDDAKHENDELVVNNRWGFKDLTSYMMEEEPWFQFELHSALGGCCDRHPAGKPTTVYISGRKIDLPSDRPIFPEEYSVEKLAKLKKRFGPYYFSCQYLNDPISPEDADFKVEWLNYYDTYQDANGYERIRHEVKDGIVRRDRATKSLEIAITVDPNHSGNQAQGRARHAIVVTGRNDDDDYYLLEYWAKASGYDLFFSKLYEVARWWNIRRVGFETVAAQKYAAYHINYLNRTAPYPIQVIPLEGEVENPDGTTSHKKEFRIRNVLEPIYASGRFWCRHSHQDFIQEYKQFPSKGSTVDILDALAYAPQLLRSSMSYDKYIALKARNQARLRELRKPYAVAGVN